MCQALWTTEPNLFDRLNSSFGPLKGARSASSARLVQMMSSASEHSAAGRSLLFLSAAQTAVTEACSDRTRGVAVTRATSALSWDFKLEAALWCSVLRPKGFATLGHCVQISFHYRP